MSSFVFWLYARRATISYYSGQTSFDKYELPYSSRSIKTEQPLLNTAVINRNTTPLVFMPVVKQNRSKCVHVSHLGAETAGTR